MGTHYHIWRYTQDEDGVIRSMERDVQIFPKRRQANYALTDGRTYWKAGQVLQCVDGAFCQPMPEEMVNRGMPLDGVALEAELSQLPVLPEGEGINNWAFLARAHVSSGLYL